MLLRDVAGLQARCEYFENWVQRHENSIENIKSDIVSIKLLLYRFLVVISLLGIANLVGKAGLISLLDIIK